MFNKKISVLFLNQNDFIEYFMKDDTKLISFYQKKSKNFHNKKAKDKMRSILKIII
jgi:hypothetical protein